MKDIDSRPLSEIPFAQDLPEDQRAAADRIRNFFHLCGCTTAQDIQKGSCQDELWRLAATEYISEVSYVRELQFARRHMAGAGFGLTCKAPGYCLIHECIGEETNKSIGIKDVTWRDLTPEEEVAQAQVVAHVQQKLAGKGNPSIGQLSSSSRGKKNPRALAIQLLEAAIALLEDTEDKT